MASMRSNAFSSIWLASMPDMPGIMLSMDGRAAGYDGASGGSWADRQGGASGGSWADRQGGAVSANRSDRHSSVSTGELTREAVEQITKQVIARLMATK